MKVLYTESCKTMMKENEEGANTWKSIPCSWTGRINIVKMSMLLKAIYRFNVILIKIPIAFFYRNEKKF